MSHMDTVNGVPVVGAEPPADASGVSRVRSSSLPGGSSIPRPAGDFFNTISHTAVAPPLDYSFQDIKSMSELAEHEPAGGKKTAASPSSKESSPSPTAAAAAAAGPKAVEVQSPASTSTGVVGRKNPKSVVSGLRLAYNELESLDGFVAAVEAVLGPDARTNLTWLDLSHNRLTTIDEVLTYYPNLTSLYLHGNLISSIHEVRKLSQLPGLQKLTLHGCPIYQARANHGLRNPRSGIIYHLRGCVLKSLDFITITNADRRNSLRWAEQNKPKKKRRPTEGEDGEGSPVRR